MTTPAGPSTNDFNNAFAKAYGAEEFKIQGKVTVDKDSVARMTVRFKGKDYTIEVGSEFVQGFNTDEGQNFAKQLGALLKTMHGNAGKMTTGFVKGNEFSYNGKTIDLDTVKNKITETSGEIAGLKQEIENETKRGSGLELAVERAEAEKTALAPEKGPLGFGKRTFPQGEDKYDKATARHEEIHEALGTSRSKLATHQRKLKQLEEEIAEYKVADLFQALLKGPPQAAIRVVGVAPAPAPSPPPNAPSKNRPTTDRTQHNQRDSTPTSPS